MKRTAFASALLALLLMSSHDARAQQRDFSGVQIKATKVAGNVYMLEGAGGNIGVSAGEDGILIVDDQFAPLADKIRVALKEINPSSLRFVLNTHYHGDHTGGNAQFGRESTIVAHDNVRRRLASEQTVLGQKIPASPKEALPVVTYAQSVSIHFNGEEIKVMHLPTGHTDGDSAILFTAANVVRRYRLGRQRAGSDAQHRRFDCAPAGRR
jgi:glyoxylase-like metal-dependent hydrolase (beta-lactamase superfamily II)